MSYQVWALLSALFAGMTAVLGKKGVENVPVNLAVAVRVFVVLLFACTIAVATQQTKLNTLNNKAWIYLSLSGIGTGLSWLCYYRALQMGPVSAIAPIDKLSFVIAMVLGFIFLKEKVSLNVAGGAVLIVVGVLLTLKK